MVFLFKEDGGFNTEDGLFIAPSGVFSKVSFESETDEMFFFWALGVLSKGAVEGLDELIWCNASSGECELPGSFVRGIGSSFSFIKSFLHSALGIAITLLRMHDGDLDLEQWLV